MIKLTLGFLMVLCSGCVSCGNHPIACPVAAVLITGAILASQSDSPEKLSGKTLQPVSCEGGACK